ncbi:MAG: hypothetical protein P1V97_20655 [Planctomycetota bacterium]|nr:hypothetical protein [Planctomycetota bacterium]
MKGSAISLLSVLAILGGAVHGKFAHDNEVSAKKTKKSDPNTDTPNPKVNNDASGKDPSTNLALEPDPRVIAARKLLDRGQFQEAKLKFEDAIEGNLVAEDYTVAQQGLAEIQLYKSLMEVIAEHPFADGKGLYEVILPSGNRVTAKVLGNPKGDRITLKVRDGRQLSVSKKRLKKMDLITKSAFRSQVEEELGFRVAEIGEKQNPVELYRVVVSYCLEYRMKDKAFSYLKAALSKPNGSVLIDLFCDGDTRAYHRAQARMAGITDLAMLDEIEEKSPVFEKDLPEPDDTPPPERTPDREPEVKQPTETPKPRVKKPKKPYRPKRVSRAKEMRAENAWKRADILYRQGLKEYRNSLRGTTASQAKSIAKARSLFEKGLSYIYELQDKEIYEEEPALDKRGVELQQMIYDCQKRQKAR